MIQHQGNNNGQLMAFGLLDLKPPYFDHVFKKLKMNRPVRIAFMLKKKINIAELFPEFDLIQHIRIIILKVFFDKRILTDFKSVQMHNINYVFRQIILQKRPGIGQIAPGLPEQFIMGVI